jgi:hypothetical protein
MSSFLECCGHCDLFGTFYCPYDDVTPDSSICGDFILNEFAEDNIKDDEE